MVLVSLKPFLFYYAQQADYVIKNLGNLEPLIMTLFQQLLLLEGDLLYLGSLLIFSHWALSILPDLATNSI
jgi:hypothetical protein